MGSLSRGPRKIRRCAWIVAAILASGVMACAQASPATTIGTPVARAVGTIKNVASDTLTITSDSGAEIAATLAASTRILRVPPGEKDLKNATPLQAQKLQTGDRVLVRGQASADGHTIAALSVIVMKQADVSAKQQREQEDWQKRGVGGLVSAVDSATGTITVSTGGFGGSHNVAVHTTKDTVARRYAPGSVKFDDARPAPLDQIKAGDQLRARGARSADGNEITAEEIVSGSFRNIAGTVTAVDPAAGTVTVQDAIAKAPVVVGFTPDSQIKKLPAEMAQRIAMRLKAGVGEGGGPAAGGQVSGNSSGFRPTAEAPGAGGQSPRGPGGMRGGWGGPPDLQRLLSRLPGSKLSDLQQGDAVMIVSTVGADSRSVTAITLLGGVEAILTASPNRNAAMMLSPWTLGASGGEGEGGPQ